MDALTYIFAFMTAMMALWIGYFIGNYFPVVGKAKRIRDANKGTGRSGRSLGSISNLGKRIMDWLLEREEEQNPDVSEFDEELVQEALSVETEVPPEGIPASTPTPSQPLGPADLVDVPEGFDPESTVLWHDRRTMKIVARIKDEMVDIDDELSQSQHGALSMLLVDLQERVGLTATLRDAIAEGTDRAFKETERRRRVPKKEEEVKPPSLNPLRTIVNYVQSDIPDIDSTASIPDQINTILQDMIKGTPMEERGVSMAEWPNRGAVFIVGVDVYEDIHKIPDPDVRVAIREAVKKWELTQDDDG
jgi:hypothetical protein